MEWQYRGVADREGNYSVRQVFYDSGAISSFSAEPVPPYGETEDELVTDIAMMLEGLKQPFLLEGDFIPEGSEDNFTFIHEDENKYH
jgi:hypothetical protein